MLHSTSQVGPNPEHASRADVIRQYAHLVYGHAAGYVFVACGTPAIGANGKTSHPDFREQVFAWPRQESELVSWLAERSARQDTWATPGLSWNPVRRLERRRSLPSAHVWVDLDRPGLESLTRLHRLIEQGGFSINSGHGVHGYVRLDRPAEAERVADLNRRLAGYLHGDPAPAPLNSFLRPAGTWNRKADPVAPVAFLLLNGGPGWDVEQLALRLPPPVSRLPVRTVTATPAQAPGRLPPVVAQILRDAPDADLDRSSRFYSLVRACRAAGLTDGEALAVVDQHRPSRSKYGARLTQEALRILEKLP